MPSSKLQRITFRGNTGDARPTGRTVHGSRFHLTRRATNDPGLAVYEAVQSDNQSGQRAADSLGPGLEGQRAAPAIRRAIWCWSGPRSERLSRGGRDSSAIGVPQAREVFVASSIASRSCAAPIAEAIGIPRERAARRRPWA